MTVQERLHLEADTVREQIGQFWDEPTEGCGLRGEVIRLYTKEATYLAWINYTNTMDGILVIEEEEIDDDIIDAV